VFGRMASGSQRNWLSVVDEHPRECRARKVNPGITSDNFNATLSSLLSILGFRRQVRSDRGAWFITRTLLRWLKPVVVGAVPLTLEPFGKPLAGVRKPLLGRLFHDVDFRRRSASPVTLGFMERQVRHPRALRFAWLRNADRCAAAFAVSGSAKASATTAHAGCAVPLVRTPSDPTTQEIQLSRYIDRSLTTLITNTGHKRAIYSQAAVSHDSAVRRLARRIALEVTVRSLRLRRWRRPKGHPAAQGIAVIGFLETASGLGAAARGLLTAIDSLSPARISITPSAPTPLIPDVCGNHTSQTDNSSQGFNVGVHVYNPDVFLGLVRRFGGELLLPNRINLAVVNWETERLPRTWPAVLSLYELLAAPSRFTARAVSIATGREVHVLPNCVCPRPPRARIRTDSHYEFLCLFDAHSDFDRKNPLAVIRAFCQAASDLPRDVSCRLRVKCHSNTPPSMLAILKAEIGSATVEIIAETLSEDGMQRLWAECDCLVSLHRSEGFGLPVAEALARGIPVVVTRQGGILDFIDDRGGLLIDGLPAVPGPAASASGYHEWSGWVEPDIQSAAAAMRQVMSNYPAAAARARDARERLAECTSPNAVLKAYLLAVSADPVSQYR
jgi:glycosyltransferase involved in cell wall biosynthesis